MSEQFFESMDGNGNTRINVFSQRDTSMVISATNIGVGTTIHVSAVKALELARLLQDCAEWMEPAPEVAEQYSGTERGELDAAIKATGCVAYTGG